MPASTVPSAYWVYVGNFGDTEPRGIFLLRFDPAQKKLVSHGLAAPAEHPNFVIVHPSGRYVYAVTSTKTAAYKGSVEAFSADPKSGKLTFLNRQPSGGDNPAHLAIDPTGKLLIVANYSGGSIAAFPLAADGRLEAATAVIQHKGSSVNPKRQSEPHPHGIFFTPDGNSILVPDLGLDKVLTYAVDTANGTLTPGPAAATPPGSGPRHVAFSKDAGFLYVINELASTLTIFAHDNGRFTELQTLAPWPKDDATSGAEIELHPNGGFLYASNRGYDSIAIGAVDAKSGLPKIIGLHPTGGRTPRHFGLDPTAGFILASNMDSNGIRLHSVDPITGGLMQTPTQVSVEAPCCVAFIGAAV